MARVERRVGPSQSFAVSEKTPLEKFRFKSVDYATARSPYMASISAA
jgi:hypothetical protein